LAIRINWKSSENLSYIFFSLAVAGFVQFGIILFAYYFLPIINPYILILIPLSATFLNCGSAILFAEFFVQYRHRKIVQQKYKKPKNELTIEFSLIFSNLLVIGMFLIFFIGATFIYMVYLPSNQIRQILVGFFLPFVNINIFDLPAFFFFMGADLGGSIPPFGLVIILDYLVKRPIKIRKKKI